MFPMKFVKQELTFPLKIHQQIMFSRSMAGGPELICYGGLWHTFSWTKDP